MRIRLFISALVLLSSCSDNSEIESQIQTEYQGLSLPEIPFNYENIELPSHYLVNDFPNNLPFQTAAITNDNSPTTNPITNEGALLGRVLFYEKKLSQNGTISCASCHKQSEGFSDSSMLSLGFEGGSTRRHSMGLTNARFYDSGAFFWDERAASLEEQVLMPFQDPVEMGMTLEQIVETVEAQDYSDDLFSAAFGDPQVSSDRISKALAQFVRSLISIDAKYDNARALAAGPMEDFDMFNAEENQGKRLFFNPRNGAPPCASCHQSEAFIGARVPPNMTTGTSNNGLSLENEDLGVFETTLDNRDRGKFKVNSLRNIAVSAPFMHDGRFSTLGEVVDHYSNGIQDVPNLHPTLRDQNGNPVQYNFSTQEKQALIAFLETLTDEVMINDEKFSDPFH
ncbi:MAG: cytochrome-c peroxidase [Flavobacteriaceae bacterium]